MPRRSLALVLALSALAACKSTPAEGPAPEWFVKATGVTPESVEARRLERQAAFERSVAAQASVAVEPAPEPVVVAAPEARVNYGISLAMFEDDRLDECIGSYLTPSPGNDLQAKEAIEKRATDAADKIRTWKGPDKPLLLSKTCVEQFPERAVFATCVSQKEAKLGHMTSTTYYYNQVTLDKSDTRMKDCISAGGDWKVNPDQTLVERARIAGKQRKLEKMLADAEATVAKYE